MSGSLADWVAIGGGLGDTVGGFAGAGLGVYNLVVTSKRRDRGAAFLDRIVELTGETAEELLVRIAKDPATEELVSTTVEIAIRTAGESRRDHLARAAAAALSNDLAGLDEYRIIIRTLGHLDEPEVQLLAVIDRKVRQQVGPRQLQTELMERLSEKDLSGLWPHAGEVLGAVIANLVKEGILSLADLGHNESPTRPSTPSWKVTKYGRRLLKFLGEDSGSQPT